MPSNTRSFLERLQAHIHGDTLDLGAGTGKYREIIKKQAKTYTALDGEPGPNIDIVGDVHALPFPDASFDTVISTQVMEHVKEPWRMVEEIARILRPGGVCLLTAPFMLQFHADPCDYYRYTTEGARHLFERVGLQVIETEKVGGWLAVLGEMVRFSWASPYAKTKPGFLRRNLVRVVHDALCALDRPSPDATIYATTSIVAMKPSSL